MKLIDLFSKLFKLFPQCHYINGPSQLPAPLSSEKEQEYLLKLSLDPDDMVARNVLIEHNLRLVVYIAKKFENTGILTEDLVSIGTIGLCKAVASFKAEKNIKLATYASRCIENEILMYLRKNAAQRSEVSIDEPLNTDGDGNELVLSDVLESEGEVCDNLEQREEQKIIRNAVMKLSERDRSIIILRFGLFGEKEQTQKQVADKMNISQSYISRLEKKIIRKLKKEIV
ncbi:MAG: sigma-70 family RNA polymerase sigma factor [Ruminococcaceae bacterium]|nr:sigma-70 family RNA polymerase sigma factor [Oscillospiraceae bacterium]